MPPPMTGVDWRQTWGKLRFPLGKADLTVISGGANCADYNTGFVAADGSLFRQDYGYYGDLDLPPSRFYYNSDIPGVPPPRQGYFFMDAQTMFAPNPPAGIQPWMDRDDYLQLAGVSVTMTGGGFTLSSDAWTSPPGFQTVAPDLGTLTSVGKLAAF